jgi:hypothetical protein
VIVPYHALPELVKPHLDVIRGDNFVLCFGVNVHQ